MKTKLNININGNRKLQNIDVLRYMIFNLPAVSTCPYATELCRASCYALKAERMYKAVKPSRERNLEDTKKESFVSDMISDIETLLNSKAYKNKLVIFRIHESGDFYNQAYFDKWVAIAKHFDNNKYIKFLAYTKSVKFVQARLTEIPANFTIRFSVWNDTKQEQIKIANDCNLPIYTAFPKAELDNKKDFSKCTCENCSTCLKCVNKDIKKIAVAIH